MRRLAEGQPRPVIVDNHKVAPPSRESMKSNMEELIHHFKLFTRACTCRKASATRRSNTPRRVRRLPGVRRRNKPYRLKLRAPGFSHLAGLDELSRGHMLADVTALIGSLDIVFGDIDR